MLFFANFNCVGYSMIAPYNTGKVLIGCNYQRPLPNLVNSRDAELIQAALLNTKNKSFTNFIKRVVGI